MPTVVLGVTGCIGAYKACELLRELQKRSVEVRVVMTPNAARFVSPMTFEALSGSPVFLDQFALGESSDIQHISLADAADLLLVAPATANTLGKFAHGLADDALSTLYTATKAPVLIAPAMNLNMLEHPAVVKNMELLRSRGVAFVDPGSGYLACGWLGKGRLAEVAEIVEAAMRVLSRRKDLAAESILVTAGPTVEDLDPVRFVSNRSSGKMGYRLAEAARDRGASVVLVSGPTSLEKPHGIDYVAVRSARDMHAAVVARAEGATIVAMAAAVSDYRPASASAQKLKKADGALSVEMVRTPDILRSLGAAKGSRFLIGFAAETENVLESARQKRLEKNADLLVANDVSSSGAVFGQEQSAAVLIDARGETAVPRGSKRALADRIWDRVLELKAARG